ncbi:SDR family NAD(P)-dependent oxidoreductase [Streptomyces sp. NPDC058287]|uniref:SDR family NAD(P)-dependent oxidoreductase n=1 Tax=unclassified Streptomyces TaxID=2593676 RepID=UPI0036EB3A45
METETHPASDRPGTAVVTGASSGIGDEYAVRLAAIGHDLVLVARRTHRLTRLAERLRSEYGVQVTVVTADLAEADDLARVAERVAGPDVTLLVNNAGINGYGPFTEVDSRLQARVVAVNVTAPTVLARAALEGMVERGRGALINVSSLLAFSGGMSSRPGMGRAVYASTKSYLVTFSRILAGELGAESPVRVQVVCPGYTATEFHLTQGDRPVEGDIPIAEGGGMPAPEVVTASLAALRTGEVVCIPGLAEPAAVDQLGAAEAQIRTAMGGQLAPRYRRVD